MPFLRKAIGGNLELGVKYPKKNKRRNKMKKLDYVSNNKTQDAGRGAMSGKTMEDRRHLRAELKRGMNLVRKDTKKAMKSFKKKKKMKKRISKFYAK